MVAARAGRKRPRTGSQEIAERGSGPGSTVPGRAVQNLGAPERQAQGNEGQRSGEERRQQVALG